MKIFLVIFLISQIYPSLFCGFKEDLSKGLSRMKLRRVNPNILLSGPYLSDDWEFSTSAVLNKKYFAASLKFDCQDTDTQQSEKSLVISTTLKLGYVPNPRVALYSNLKYKITCFMLGQTCVSTSFLNVGLGSRIALTQNISCYLEQDLLSIGHPSLYLLHAGFIFGA